MVSSSSSSCADYGTLSYLVITVMFLFVIAVHGSNAAANADSHLVHLQVKLNSTETEQLVPLMEQGKEMLVLHHHQHQRGRRRKLRGSFKLCAMCTCCSRGVCLPSPCCYAINCNIPNRPFGFCSFTPKTCNCFRCHL